MAESYQSQEAVILRRASERNVDPRQLQDFLELKIKEISTAHPDPAYSYLWRLAKVERLVWDRFFPMDAFPGVMLYQPPRSQATPQSKNHLNLPWTHDRFNPTAQASLFQESYLFRPQGGRVWPNDRFEDGRGYIAEEGREPRRIARDKGLKMNRQMGDHYSPPRIQHLQLIGQSGGVANSNSTAGPSRIVPQGPGALQRLTLAEIAARDAQYPRPVTFREQLKAAGELVTNPATVNPNPPRPPQVLRLSRQINANSAITTQSRECRGRSKERARERQTRADFGDPYDIMEGAMESLAKKGAFRNKMFAYLQGTRDTVRAVHPSCSRHIRNYLADKTTWDHFWPGTQFPRVAPRNGHAEECVRRFGSQENAPARGIFDQLPAKSGAHTPSAGLGAYFNAPNPVAQLNERSLIDVSNSSRSTPERGGLSSVFSAAINSSPFAKVKVEPVTSPVKVEDTAMSEVLANVSMSISHTDTVMQDGTVTSGINQVWGSATAQRPMAKAVPRLSAGSAVTQSFHHSGNLQSAYTGLNTAEVSPVRVFTAPDEMWKQFMRHSAVEDIEREEIERTIRKQGDLRLVFDDQSNQVVTVHELIKRTQYRYALKSKLKRKADENDRDRDAKRAATIFLDKLANERA